MSSVELSVGRERIALSRDVFELLFENSVVHNHQPYRRAVEAGKISFSTLLALARKAEIPYSLFFAPLAVVEKQVELNNSKLLQGLGKDAYSLNARASVELRDVELIVKDLIRKQQLLKKHDRSLQENRIVGLLGRPGAKPQDEAEALLRALKLDRRDIQAAGNKDRALATLIRRLEDRQVLVSQSVNGYMPQHLKRATFSGLAVRDKKVPYIFLAGGDHGDHSEPVGRRVFTLTLMAVLVASGDFRPVTYNGHVVGTDPGREYEIVGDILMPASSMRTRRLTDLDAVRSAAEHFKVTPSALVVRAAHLKQIDRTTAGAFLDRLADEFARNSKSSPRTPKPVNAVKKYAGRELSMRMLDALDAGRIGQREFCRQVTLNRLKPEQLDEFRVALR